MFSLGEREGKLDRCGFSHATKPPKFAPGEEERESDDNNKFGRKKQEERDGEA